MSAKPAAADNGGDDQELARQLYAHLARQLREQRAARSADDDGLNGRPLGAGGPADGVPLAGTAAGVLGAVLGAAADGVIGNAVYDALRHGLLHRLRRSNRSLSPDGPEVLMDHLARVATVTECAERDLRRPNLGSLVVHDRRLTDTGLRYRLQDGVTRLTATVAIDLGAPPSGLRVEVTLVAATRDPRPGPVGWPTPGSLRRGRLTGSRDGRSDGLPLDLTELTTAINDGLRSPGMAALSVADRLDRLPTILADRRSR